MPTPLTDTDLYLARLGFEMPPEPTLDTLCALQQRHTAAFPFETLSTLLRLPVPLDPAALQKKLLHDARGGYCYELNRLFQMLLRQLGFDVRGLAARVVMGGPEDAVHARSHYLLRVMLQETPYIVDVGFGGMVPTAPLRLDTEAPQTTAHESFRVIERDGDYLLRARVADQWRGLYVFDLQPQADIDTVVGNWYVSTHPDSPFLDRLAVARTGPGWRKTLNGNSFAIHHLDAPSERRALPDADAVMHVLREEFDLRPPSEAGLHETLTARLFATNDA